MLRDRSTWRSSRAAPTPTTGVGGAFPAASRRTGLGASSSSGRGAAGPSRRWRGFVLQPSARFHANGVLPDAVLNRKLDESRLTGYSTKQLNALDTSLSNVISCGAACVVPPAAPRIVLAARQGCPAESSSVHLWMRGRRARGEPTAPGIDQKPGDGGRGSCEIQQYAR